MTVSPFRIEGPAKLSISGGRTSGMLLARILEAHGGTLPADVVATFANTGEEDEGTLEFVREMGERWTVPIRWVEFTEAAPHWREVTYCTASRKGEPFDALVRWKGRADGSRGFVPNHFRRTCTEMLKGYPQAQLMRSLGFDPGDMFPAHDLRKGTTPRPPEYEEIMGLRADEQKRMNKHAEKHWMRFPLAEAGVMGLGVRSFWAAESFDLCIPEGAGNCRLCFEKGGEQLVNVVRDAPDGAGVDRWIERERFARSQMNQRRSYAQIAAKARGQLPLWHPPVQDQQRPCMCGDEN